MKHLLLPVTVIILLFTSEPAATQKIRSLSIGDKVPENIWKAIPKKKETKLVILDFWSTNCGACIIAFPKMEGLQKKFDKELQVILVNPTENDAKVKERFDKINKNRDKGKQIIIPASLPAINGDMTFMTLFPHNSVPQHVWLTGDGKVLGITEGANATAKHIQAAINGQRINLELKNDELKKDLTENGLIQTRHALLSPAYYSAFMHYDRGIGKANLRRASDSASGTFRVSVRGKDIPELFRIAFRWDGLVVTELGNKEIVERPNNADAANEWERKYCFSYEMQGVLKDQKNWMSDRTWEKTMQDDLNRFLGNLYGIEGLIEKRKYMSLVITKTKDGSLKTSGAEQYIKKTDTTYTLINQPFYYILNALNGLEDRSKEKMLINETGYTGNIDIQINGSLKDFENVRQQLKLYGMDIIEKEKELEVLIIKDKIIIGNN